MAEMLDQKGERIDVSGCVNAIYQDYIELAEIYKVSLTNKGLSSTTYIHANLIDFKNIVSNIVENGIRYSDTSKKDRFVAITTNRVLFGVSIRIKDNGLGISSNRFRKIGKEPVKRSTNEISGGGGVGLFKKMADNNNIKITVRSETGVGTDIKITKREYIPKFCFAKRKKL